MDNFCHTGLTDEQVQANADEAKRELRRARARGEWPKYRRLQESADYWVLHSMMRRTKCVRDRKSTRELLEGIK